MLVYSLNCYNSLFLLCANACCDKKNSILQFTHVLLVRLTWQLLTQIREHLPLFRNELFDIVCGGRKIDLCLCFECIFPFSFPYIFFKILELFRRANISWVVSSYNFLFKFFCLLQSTPPPPYTHTHTHTHTTTTTTTTITTDRHHIYSAQQTHSQTKANDLPLI